MVGRDEDGAPTLTLYNEKAINLFEHMFSMFDSNYAALDLEGKVMHRAFKEGRLTMYATTVRTITNYSDLEMDFGPLPFPKYDDTIDRYYQLIDGGSSLAIIPITVGDLERTGAITEALAYYGNKLLFPAYYDNALFNRYLRDDESVEMIEIIRQSQTVDLAYFNNTQFGGAFANPGRTLAANRELTLTTLYNQNKSSVEAKIAQAMEIYNQ